MFKGEAIDFGGGGGSSPPSPLDETLSIQIITKSYESCPWLPMDYYYFGLIMYPSLNSLQRCTYYAIVRLSLLILKLYQDVIKDCAYDKYN